VFPYGQGLGKGPVVRMRYIRPSCIKLRSSFFWDVTQRRLVATDVSGILSVPIERVKH